MEWNARLWRKSIERFKAFMISLAAPLGRSERRTAATNYVQGLLMPASGRPSKQSVLQCTSWGFAHILLRSRVAKTPFTPYASKPKGKRLSVRANLGADNAHHRCNLLP